jgi:hypothetical protein
MNDARSLAMKTLGKEAEDYPNAFDMADIGNVPLSVINTMTALKQYGAADSTNDSISESQEDAVEIDEKMNTPRPGELQ